MKSYVAVQKKTASANLPYLKKMKNMTQIIYKKMNQHQENISKLLKRELKKIAQSS
jgi:hypothetical protein